MLQRLAETCGLTAFGRLLTQLICTIKLNKLGLDGGNHLKGPAERTRFKFIRCGGHIALNKCPSSMLLPNHKNWVMEESPA